MLKNCEVSYNKEKERIELIIYTDDGRHSATYITDKSRADPVFMCNFLKEYIERNLRAMNNVKEINTGAKMEQESKA